MPTPKRYMALLCFHEDADDYVTSNVVLASAESTLDESTVENIICAQLTEGRDMPLVHSLIMQDQPFDKPTLCRLSLVVIPDGSRFPAVPQVVSADYTISETCTFLDAFRELLEQRMDGHTILASAYEIIES